MPQVQLPVFPHGSTLITPELACLRKENQVAYFNGHLPVFTHPADDLASFRLFTTQLIVNGTATQGQIARVFGVPVRTIKRCVKRYRERGASAFFTAAPKRQGHRLSAERLAQAQGMLEEGQPVPRISEQLGVLATTLHKAIDHGRLRPVKKRT